ncbi:MAG: hypothetical protein CSA86_04685 [Arcobacter sp.]|nr:MAG: hypothetical protein CSA86_04685 [Arcobacter sp.]
MIFNVALIGLGNISLLYDDKKKTKTILSHIKALYKNKNFTLKYCVDINTINKSKVEQFFPQVSFYTDISKIEAKADIDILILATPTSSHFEIFEKLKKNTNIQYFLIEKPLFDRKHTLDCIDKSIEKKLIINYIRVFEPNIQKFQDQINSLTFGEPQKIIGTYTKGIKNNGTHFISLINFLFNNPIIKNIKILSSQKGLEDDLTLDIMAIMEYKNKQIPLYLIGLDESKYTVFDIDFYFHKAKVRIEDNSKTITIEKSIQNTMYSSYKTLGNTKQILLDFDNIMKYPYEYIYNILNKKTIPINFIEHEKRNIEFYKNLEKMEFNNE